MVLYYCLPLRLVISQLVSEAIWLSLIQLSIYIVSSSFGIHAHVYVQPQLLRLQTALRQMLNSHLMCIVICKMHFGQYQASSAALG